MSKNKRSLLNGYSRLREATGEELASVFQTLDCGKQKGSNLPIDFHGNLCQVCSSTSGNSVEDCSLGNGCSKDLEFSPLEGFLVEGLSPSKMVKETKRETCDRRFVASVWSGRTKEWAAFLACGTSRGAVIIWDSFYGPKNSNLRKDLWVELQELFGLTYPKWCVGGDSMS
ncbi:hypothetical protein CK203_043581 [Vitis vinifera]|uniref:Uncharacterized protein n=1 Tax=Vitis vinifera TaxID=29760 RepID=A0A438HYH6_VITVI|nr:hypothetical protein CK203_043581 [Vitis vinifera]